MHFVNNQQFTHYAFRLNAERKISKRLMLNVLSLRTVHTSGVGNGEHQGLATGNIRGWHSLKSYHIDNQHITQSYRANYLEAPGNRREGWAALWSSRPCPHVL
jgi:hypothetical protein